MLDLRLLKQAITLAHYGSFARAADALGIKQPTLSRNIAALESALGEQLFTRSKTGVKPTAFGDMLLVRGRVLLASASALERDFRVLRGLGSGPVRVASGPFPTALSVATAVGRLVDRHRELKVDLVSSDPRTAIQAVLDSSVDFAVCEVSVVQDETRLEIESLPRHPMLLYCRTGHPLLLEKAPTIGRVLQFPLVATRLATRGTAAIAPLAQAGRADRETGDFLPPVKVDSIAVACEVVKASDAVSAAPRSTIETDLEAGRVVALPVTAAWLYTDYGLIFRRGRMPTPGALALMQYIRTVEAEIVERESGAGAGATHGTVSES